MSEVATLRSSVLVSRMTREMQDPFWRGLDCLVKEDKLTVKSLKGSSREEYMLATGDAAIVRLRLLDEIFGPATRDLLTGVGLRRQDDLQRGLEFSHYQIHQRKHFEAESARIGMDIG